MFGLPQTSLYAALPKELQNQIRDAGSLRTFEHGQLIAARGENNRALWVIEHGQVRMSNSNRDGVQLDTAILEAGDSFGEFTLFADAPRYFDFFAIGETKVRYLSKARFEPLLRNSADMQDAIISMLSKRLLLAVQMIDDMRRLPLIAQLAQALVARSQYEASVWVYRGTQTELAEFLGVSRVALGQALNKLKSQGLLNTSYGSIELSDREALNAFINQHRAL